MILSSEKTVAKMRDMFDFNQSVFLAGFDPFVNKVFTLLLPRFHFLSSFFQSCPPCILISIKYVSFFFFFFFSESPLNTDTRIIRAVWHVPLVSLSTRFQCNTFQSVQLLLSLFQVLLVYIAFSLQVRDQVLASV